MDMLNKEKFLLADLCTVKITNLYTVLKQAFSFMHSYLLYF
jgi:hypothetical protein